MADSLPNVERRENIFKAAIGTQNLDSFSVGAPCEHELSSMALKFTCALEKLAAYGRAYTFDAHIAI